MAAVQNKSEKGGKINKSKGKFLQSQRDILEEGARSLLILEGDALVRFLLSEDTLDVRHGGQTLHLIYILERFLAELKVRGAVVHVTFFACNDVWCVTPTLRFARELVIHHVGWLIAQGKLDFELRHFPRPDGASFRRYVGDFQPSIALVQLLTLPHTLQRLAQAGNVQALPKAVHDQLEERRGRLAQAFFGLEITLASIDDLVFRGTSMQSAIRKAVRSQDFNTAATPDNDDDDTLSIPRAVSAACTRRELVEGALRELTHHPVADAAAASSTALCVDIARVLVANFLLCERLPLHLRAHALPEPCDNTTGAQASRVSQALTRVVPGVLQRFSKLFIPRLADCSEALCDVLDGRMVYVLLHQWWSAGGDITSALRLPPNIASECAAMWRTVDAGEWEAPCSRLDECGPLEPVDGYQLHPVAVRRLPPATVTHAASSDLCGKCFSAGASAAAPPTRVAAAVTAAAPAKVASSWEDMESDEDAPAPSALSSAAALGGSTLVSSSPSGMVLRPGQSLMLPCHAPLVDALFEGRQQLWPHYDENSTAVREHRRPRGPATFHNHHYHSHNDLAAPKSKSAQERMLKDRLELHRYADTLAGLREKRTIVLNDESGKGKEARGAGKRSMTMTKSDETAWETFDEKLLLLSNAPTEEHRMQALSAVKTQLASLQPHAHLYLDRYVEALAATYRQRIKLEIGRSLALPWEATSEKAKKKQKKSLELAHRITLYRLTLDLVKNNAATSFREEHWLLAIAGFIMAELPACAATLLPQLSAESQAMVRPLLMPSEDGASPTAAAADANGLPDATEDIAFQLQSAGQYLHRETQTVSTADAIAFTERYGFVPEPWQRRMVDAIDENRSLVVTAPTSSGKTFIAFYALEHVMRQDDKGVAVFVLPTKALVNQVYAEIYTTFTKHFKHSNSQELLGQFTGERKIAVTNCQILVTVPQCLQILLLSPDAQLWSKRLRYVIFDEVHNISDAESGAVWERLLALVDCPFIALSATIGNPELLVTWLRDLRPHRREEIQLVAHFERVNDVAYYAFDGEQRDIVPVPPFVAWSKKSLTSADRSTEVQILPHHITGFFQSISQELNGLLPAVELDARTPRVLSASYKQLLCELVYAYADGVPLESGDSERGLTATAAVLAKALPLNMLPEHVASGLNALQACGCLEVVAVDGVPTLHVAPACRELRWLLRELQPARFFADAVLVTRGALVRYRACIYGLQRHLARRPEPAIAAAVATVCGPARGLVRQATAWLEENGSTDDLVRRFSHLLRTLERRSMLPCIVFALDRNLCEKLLRAAIDADIDFLEERDALTVSSHIARIELPDSGDFANGFMRGIGVHHSSVPAEYGQTVELLFRQRRLKVIIATGTLAQGIHMPCRTVVFAADSVYLTPMEFRQESGRAGRRGFDTLGNAVFFGLPFGSITRLLASPLPRVLGHMPITASLCLQLMQAVHNERTDSPVFKSALRLLRQPFFSLRSERNLRQMEHHFRFSVEFLMRHGHLAPGGQPRQLVDLLTRLHYKEPSNFVLASLLRDGVLHEIARRHPDTQCAADELLLVFCHLFGTMVLLHDEQYIEERRALKTPSTIVLGPMPRDVAARVAAYNADVMRIFTEYVRALAADVANDLGPDNRMPLSALTFPPRDGLPAEEGLAQLLGATAVPYAARSAFIATSGNDDRFASAYELVDTVRDPIVLDGAMVPLFATATRDGTPLMFNAFIFDYYQHRQYAPLLAANGVRETDARHAVHEFVRTVRKIKIALEDAFGLCPADRSSARDHDHHGGEDEPEQGSRAQEQALTLHLCEALEFISQRLEPREQRVWQRRDVNLDGTAEDRHSQTRGRTTKTQHLNKNNKRPAPEGKKPARGGKRH